MIWFPAGTVAEAKADAATAIAILDGFAGVLTTRNGTQTFPISAGSNRVLIVSEFSRAAPTPPTPVTAISYGGQAMTQIIALGSTGGPDSDSGLWFLNEAGIAAASGSGFTLTPNTIGITFSLSAGSYENVNQADPTVDEFSALGSSGANPTTQALTSLADGFCVAALTANAGTSDGGATEDASYSNMTERVEVQLNRGYQSVADAPTTGATFTPGTTLTHQIDGHLLAVALRPV